jgi:hypothetical protein
MDNPLTLRLLPELYAVCRYHDANVPLPVWALIPGASFVSVTRTRSELSIVAPQLVIPTELHDSPDVLVEWGWQTLEVVGPLPFNMVGVLASLTTPLAKEQISLFAVSTYDTDYLLVKQAHMGTAVALLRASGFPVQT